VPTGLTAVATSAVAANATSVIITIGGELGAASAAELGIKIPGAALSGGADITAEGTITLAVKTAAENAADELATDLGAGATASGTTVTVTGTTATVSGGTSVTVPSGVTLSVENGKLTVATNGTLTVNGTLAVALNGAIDVETGGVFNLSAAGTNAGTITIKSGGASHSTGSLAGNGKTVVQSGGEAYFGNDLFIGDSDSATANFALAEGELSFNDTTFVLDGEVTLNGRANANPTTAGNAKSWLINAGNQVLTINPDSVFTVAAGTWLILRNDGTDYPVVGGTPGSGESAPQIVFANGSKVQPDGTGSDPYVGKANFYNASSAEVFTGWQYTASVETAFTWSASASGENNAGWVDTPPAEVSGLSANPGNGEVTFIWSEPLDTDFAKVEITWANGGSAEFTKGATAKVIDNLTNNTAYTFTVKTVDVAGNKSTGVTIDPVTPVQLISLTVTGGFGDSGILATPNPLSYAGTTVTATVKADSGYAITKWYIDGVDVTGKVAQGQGNTYEITTTTGLSDKNHSLTVRATKDGHTYSQTVEFTVGGV
jgi:hypothetical protein